MRTMTERASKSVEAASCTLMQKSFELEKIEKRIGELIATTSISVKLRKSIILRIVPKRKLVEDDQLFLRSFAPSFMTTTTM